MPTLSLNKIAIVNLNAMIAIMLQMNMFRWRVIISRLRWRKQNARSLHLWDRWNRWVFSAVLHFPNKCLISCHQSFWPRAQQFTFPHLQPTYLERKRFTYSQIFSSFHFMNAYKIVTMEQRKRIWLKRKRYSWFILSKRTYRIYVLYWIRISKCQYTKKNGFFYFGKESKVKQTWTLTALTALTALTGIVCRKL